MSKLNSISIRFIPQSEQRYDTLGDWQWKGETIEIRATVSDKPHEAFLIALHELVECYLCNADDITGETVDAFDFAYKGPDEPGDMPDCPYRTKHRQAMIIEHLVANFLGLTDYGTMR